MTPGWSLGKSSLDFITSVVKKTLHDTSEVQAAYQVFIEAFDELVDKVTDHIDEADVVLYINNLINQEEYLSKHRKLLMDYFVGDISLRDAMKKVNELKIEYDFVGTEETYMNMYMNLFMDEDDDDDNEKRPDNVIPFKKPDNGQP